MMMRGIEENLSGEMKLQCKFALITMGELGLRAGELTHITREGPHDWIDLVNYRIDIPPWSPCRCGYCKHQAKQEVEKNENITFEESMKDRWKPQVRAASRSIPFDYKDDVRELFKQFFEIYDEWPLSRSTVNRRVDRIVENSEIERPTNSINPGALRAGAAKYYAKNGMNPRVLTKLMGWESESTALNFYPSADTGIEDELIKIHQ